MEIEDPHWVVISDNTIDQNSCTSNNLGASNAGISIYYKTPQDSWQYHIWQYLQRDR